MREIEVSFQASVTGVSAAWVRRMVAGTLKLEKQKSREVSVLITDDRRIRAINKKSLGHDYATDVISFWAKPGTLVGRESGYLGDLVVSAQTARSMAKELGLPFREELGRYLVHGTLHLLGYDDKASADRKKMHTRQESILKKLL